MVAGRVRDDATAADGFEALVFDEAEDGIVRAAGFEGADFLEVFAFEPEAEFWGGARRGGGWRRGRRWRGRSGRVCG